VVADANEPARMPTDAELADLTTAMHLREHGSEDDDEADEDFCPCAPTATTPMDTSAASSSADPVADKPIQAAPAPAKLVAQAMHAAEMAATEAPSTKFAADAASTKQADSGAVCGADPIQAPFVAEARSDPFPLPAAAAVSADLAKVRGSDQNNHHPTTPTQSHPTQSIYIYIYIYIHIYIYIYIYNGHAHVSSAIRPTHNTITSAFRLYLRPVPWRCWPRWASTTRSSPRAWWPRTCAR